MKVVEYQMSLPMTVERYHVCQLYMVAKASMEDTQESIKNGSSDGVECVANEPFTDGGWSGQFTHKKFSIASKVPGFITAFVDAKYFVFEEKSWNGFPRTKTKYECALFPSMVLTIDSTHHEGLANEQNALNLTPEQIKMRNILKIDIVNDTASAKEVGDPKTFYSEKAGIGPLGKTWMKDVTPVMTCYKAMCVDLPYFGWMSGRVESWVCSAMQDLLRKHHRAVTLNMDEWFGMTLSDCRKMEEEVAAELARLMNPGADHPVTVQSSPDPTVEHSDEGENEAPGGAADSAPAVPDPPRRASASFESEISSPRPDDDSRFSSSSPRGLLSAVAKSAEVKPATASPQTATSEAAAAAATLEAATAVKHSAQLFKLSEGLFTSLWVPRLVTLNGTNLQYYNDTTDAKVKDKLDISDASVMWTGPVREREHSFSVQLSAAHGRRVFWFSGGTEEESKQWMLLLQLASSVGGNSSADSIIRSVRHLGKFIPSPSASVDHSGEVSPVPPPPPPPDGPPRKQQRRRRSPNFKTSGSAVGESAAKAARKSRRSAARGEDSPQSPSVSASRPAAAEATKNGGSRRRRSEVQWEAIAACLSEHEKAKTSAAVGADPDKPQPGGDGSQQSNGGRYALVSVSDGVRVAVKDPDHWVSIHHHRHQPPFAKDKALSLDFHSLVAASAMVVVGSLLYCAFQIFTVLCAVGARVLPVPRFSAAGSASLSEVLLPCFSNSVFAIVLWFLASQVPHCGAKVLRGKISLLDLLCGIARRVLLVVSQLGRLPRWLGEASGSPDNHELPNKIKHTISGVCRFPQAAPETVFKALMSTAAFRGWVPGCVAAGTTRVLTAHCDETEEIHALGASVNDAEFLDPVFRFQSRFLVGPTPAACLLRFERFWTVTEDGSIVIVLHSATDSSSSVSQAPKAEQRPSSAGETTPSLSADDAVRGGVRCSVAERFAKNAKDLMPSEVVGDQQHSGLVVPLYGRLSSSSSASSVPVSPAGMKADLVAAAAVQHARATDLRFVGASSTSKMWKNFVESRNSKCCRGVGFAVYVISRPPPSGGEEVERGCVVSMVAGLDLEGSKWLMLGPDQQQREAAIPSWMVEALLMKRARSLADLRAYLALPRAVGGGKLMQPPADNAEPRGSLIGAPSRGDEDSSAEAAAETKEVAASRSVSAAGSSRGGSRQGGPRMNSGRPSPVLVDPGDLSRRSGASSVSTPPASAAVRAA